MKGKGFFRNGVVTTAISFLMLIFMASPGSAQTKEFNTIINAAVADQASFGVFSINADALKTALSSPSTTPLVLDLRTYREYSKGHIKGAINIYWRDIAKQESLSYLDAKIAEHKSSGKKPQIVVYNNTQHEQGWIATFLNMMGYDNIAGSGNKVLTLAWGLAAWTKDETIAPGRFTPSVDKNDFPTETTPHALITGQGRPVPDVPTGLSNKATIRISAERWLAKLSDPAQPLGYDTPRITAQELYDILNDNNPDNDPYVLSNRGKLLPANGGDGYDTGHIRGAFRVTVGKEGVSIRDKDFLPLDRLIVVHCWVGVSQQYMVPFLNMLGYNVKTMDWGISAWSSDSVVINPAKADPANVYKKDYATPASNITLGAPATDASTYSVGDPVTVSWNVTGNVGTQSPSSPVYINTEFVWGGGSEVISTPWATGAGSDASHTVQAGEGSGTTTVYVYFAGDPTAAHDSFNTAPVKSTTYDVSGGGVSSIDEIRIEGATSGNKGETVITSISGINMVNVNAIEITLSFDQNVLNVASIAPGAAISGTLFESNYDNNLGELYVAFVTTSGLTNTGSIADISFSVIGEPGSTSPLTFTDVYAKDLSGSQISPDQITDNTFTVTGGPLILTITNVRSENVTTNSATILWDTNLPADSLVKYGTSAADMISVSDPDLVTSHSILLTDLSQDTTYYYKAFSSDGTDTVNSVRLSFNTLLPEALTITTDSLPSGIADRPYSAGLQASGGVSPYSWSIITGGLPDGLSLDQSGEISGTPTTEETASFTVEVTDSAVPQQSDTRQLSIMISIVVLDGIVDNADPEFSVIGTWGTAPPPDITGYYGDDFRYAGSKTGGTGANTATWDAELPEGPGTYEVSVWYIALKALATNAPYTVNHADGSTTILVAQRINGSQWVSLGSFNFDGNASEGVTLSDDANKWVIADAVRFEPGTSPDIVISRVHTMSVTTDSATVMWITNTAADSLVEYGTASGSYTDSEYNTSQAVPLHSIKLTGLTPGTLYYYRVTSANANDSAISEEYTFTTSSGGGGGGGHGRGGGS